MISPLGQRAVHEIALRCDADESIVMRAFLHVGLLHQQELMKHIDLIKSHQEIELPYILEAQ